MSEHTGTIINIIFLLLGITIFAGIIIRFAKNRVSVQKEKITEEKAETEIKSESEIEVKNKTEVYATVTNKQFFYKRIMQKGAAPYNKPQYVITFKTENEVLHFDVAESSFDGYKINQKGMLTYIGSTLIDFDAED